MKIGTWLLSLCQPFIARVLLSLGFSVVTITGVELTVQALKDGLLSSLSVLPADMFAVFQLAGGGTALGIIFGALTTKVALWAVQNSTKLLGVNNG